MNREIAIGHWNEWKGAMRERWGKLTDDEWQQVEGDREQLVGALQRHYGYTREQAELEVDEFVTRRTAVPEPVLAASLPDEAMPIPDSQRTLPYVNDEGYLRDQAAAVIEDELTDLGDAAIDNGVRAQPGDVLGLDTDGETTSLGETAEDEDRRRVEALRDAPREEPRVRDARR